MSERSLADQIYGYLAEDEDARVCKDIPEAACDEQPRSFLLQLGAMTLTRLGDTLVSARLVLAWMLSALGAPVMFISFLVPLRESLALLPQLFIAQLLRERPVRKWFWTFGAFGQAAALAGMVAALFSFRGAALGWAVIALLAVFSLARGVCSVAAKDVLGKTISKTRRGRLSGQAASAAGLVTLLVAAAVYLSPQLEGSPLLFALLLGGSAVLWVLAGVLYAALPEVPGATAGGGNAFTEAVRSLGLLASDRHLAAFIWARALLVASAFAIPYIVVLIQRNGGGGATALGALLFADGVAGLVAGNIWGKLSDRSAHGVMAAAAGLSLLVIGAALAVFYRHPPLLGQAPVAGALLFLSAVAHHGARVGRKTYLVDMASAENRAQYTAVSNTVMGVVLLAGILLGAVDAAYGADGVLILLAAVAALAVIRCLRLPRVSE